MCILHAVIYILLLKPYTYELYLKTKWYISVYNCTIGMPFSNNFRTYIKSDTLKRSCPFWSTVSIVYWVHCCLYRVVEPLAGTGSGRARARSGTAHGTGALCNTGALYFVLNKPNLSTEFCVLISSCYGIF